MIFVSLGIISGSEDGIYCDVVGISGSSEVSTTNELCVVVITSLDGTSIGIQLDVVALLYISLPSI